MSYDSTKVTHGCPWTHGRNSAPKPGLPSPSGLQSEGHFCLLPSQRILPTAHCMVLLFLAWTWQDATLLWAWLKAHDAGPEPPWGPNRKLPHSSMIFKCLYRQPKNK